MTDTWYIRNLREFEWEHADGRGALSELGDDKSRQIGINLFALGPGEPMAMYHWEADQEGFLVLSGEAILIIDGENPKLAQSIRSLHHKTGTS